MRTRMHPRLSLGCALLVGVIGCGGSEPRNEPTIPVEQPTTGAEAPRPGKPGGGMQIEGLMGTIPARRIEDVMQAKLPAFQRCFFDGMRDVELLSGGIEFGFRVDRDGRAQWVYPRSSSVGHRATEHCLLGIARQARFPTPQGGDAAEFVWGFEIEGQDGLRAPVAWPASRVASLAHDQAQSVDACAGSSARYVVTVYVAPGGSVLGAGAAADSQSSAERIDCVLEAVRAWPFPEPGSYPAKVSFEIAL